RHTIHVPAENLSQAAVEHGSNRGPEKCLVSNQRRSGRHPRETGLSSREGGRWSRFRTLDRVGVNGFASRASPAELAAQAVGSNRSTAYLPLAKNLSKNLSIIPFEAVNLNFRVTPSMAQALR